jgi:hypothetical protein
MTSCRVVGYDCRRVSINGEQSSAKSKLLHMHASMFTLTLSGFFACCQFLSK